MKRKRSIYTMERDILLRDALYNLHPNSGATVEYCIGMAVGIVSLLMAQGYTFRDAITTLALHFPKDGRLTVPASWQSDLQAQLLSANIPWSAVTAGSGVFRRQPIG
jgi:hypothetical protein